MSTVNYSSWHKQFTGQVQVVVKADERVFQEACQYLYELIILRTPVGDPSLWNPPYWPKDYQPGTLKAAWQIQKSKGMVTIWNDTPYAYRVETGWSRQQAPSGMMRISIKEFSSIVDKIAARYKR